MWDRLCPYHEQWAPPLEPIREYLADPQVIALDEQLDEQAAFPTQLLRELRARGATALLVDPEDSSDERRVTPYQISTFAELTCRFSPNLYLWEGVNHGGLIPYFIGSDAAQQREVFRRVRAGAAAAIVLSERDHGSDLLSNETRAERGRVGSDGGFEPTPDPRAPFTHYRVTGEKDFINRGHEAEILTTLARTGRRNPVTDFTMFFIDRRPGVVNGVRWPTSAVRGAEIASVRFEGVVVPADHVIGREGEGFALVHRLMTFGRGGPAAMAAGIAEHGLQLALAHARTRQLYGEPIVRLGAIAEHVIHMTALRAIAVCMSIKQTAMVNLLGHGASYYSTVAKFLCPRLAEEAIGEGRRVLGARALLRTLPYARVDRDVTLLGIFDGSQHIMLQSLRRQLDGAPAAERDTIELVREAFGRPPRALAEVCRQAGVPVTPAIDTHLAALAALPGWVELAPVARVAGALVAIVRGLRDRPEWRSDQAAWFDATEILCGLEGLIALVEIADPERRRALGMPPPRQPETPVGDELVVRFATGWFGARLASQLRTLAYRTGTEPPPGLEGVDRDLLAAQIDVRNRLRDAIAV
jgi:alkylation response protein AidB-like acyl-CoA dehydrogenase